MGVTNSATLFSHEELAVDFGAEVFTELEEVVPDEYDANLDGDNSLLRQFPGGVPEIRSFASSAVSRTNPVLLKPRMLVRLPRTIKPGMKGKDVVALQRALWRMHQRKARTFTGNYGYWTKRQVAAFQENHGLKADGIYGPATHRKLAPIGFDAYSAYLMGHVKIAVAPTPQQKIVETAIYAYNKRAWIHYTQSSLRMQGVRDRRKPPQYPNYEDCSSITTWFYWVAGAPNPNGRPYSTMEGYTGTLAANGHQVDNPRPADIALYGYGWPYSHVSVYVGGGMCVSHGSEIGPVWVSVHYRPVNHFRSYFA